MLLCIKQINSKDLAYSPGNYIQHLIIMEQNVKDFPGGPVLKNLPSNAGGEGSIPGQRTKIPCAEGQCHNKDSV